MNTENVPTFVQGVEVDAAILRGEAIDATHHCLACGVFGWNWVWGTCPHCAKRKTEKLTRDYGGLGTE